MGLDLLYVLGGLVALVAGGDVLLRGAISLAQRLGMSPAVIGLTVIGFGTSAPELLVSVQASLADQPGLALGNPLGSNIANILLVLGAGAVVRPLIPQRTAARRDGTIMLAATAALIIIALTGVIGRAEGAGMLGGLVIFLVFSFFADKRSTAAALETLDPAPLEESEPTGASMGWGTIAGAHALGFAGLLGGSTLLVTGATALAKSWGVSDAVIGLTIVAVGTSLPELVSTVVAALKGETALAVGNVLGSNTFNSLGIVGAAALAEPLPVPESILAVDLWICGGAALLLLPVVVRGRRITRWEGLAYLALYTAYTIYAYQSG